MEKLQRKLIYWHHIPLRHGVAFKLVGTNEVREALIGEEAFLKIFEEIKKAGWSYELYTDPKSQLIEATTN